jgi:hypothetical protein
VFVADRRRGLGIGLAATGMAVLTACSGGGSAPGSLPPLSTTPAAVTSTAPLSSKAADLAAVKAVVRRYYALVNSLGATMDANAIAALSEPSCACRTFVTAVRKTAGQHETYFGQIDVIGLTAVMDSSSYAEVLATYNSSAGGTRSSSGQVLYRGVPHKGTVENFVLHKRKDRWLIVSISLIRHGRPR